MSNRDFIPVNEFNFYKNPYLHSVDLYNIISSSKKKCLEDDEWHEKATLAHFATENSVG
jgi:hypothetical protein